MSSILSVSDSRQLIMNETQLDERLTRIEKLLSELVSRQATKDYYSTTEVAALLKKAEFTVREWCRLGRVNAEKRPCGRGVSKEWMISCEELQRIMNEGLLPLR